MKTQTMKASLLSAVAAALAFAVSPLFHWRGAGGAVALVLTALVIGYFVHLQVQTAIERPLRTALGVVEAIANKDYSHRARIQELDGPLAELLTDLNALSANLQEDRLRVSEATALLDAIVSRMDVALFAFNDEGILEWTNAAAQRLLPCSSYTPTPASLGVEEWMTGPSERTVSIPGHPMAECWEMRRGTFWRGGHRYVFFLVADSRRVKREQERAAWQRLIRVMSHEVNNTLTPIESLARTSLTMIKEDIIGSASDLERALLVMEQRAGALAQFIAQYARFAKLPPPCLTATQFGDCIQRAVALETRATICVRVGPSAVVHGDFVQLEQALVNLIRNAVDAALPTQGSIAVTWICTGERVVATIVDDGPGVQNPDNLFVPFFSTKGGTGIGLVLSREIVESHGGELSLTNRRDRSGCVVRVQLPLLRSES